MDMPQAKDRAELEAELKLWRERIKIGEERYRRARGDRERDRSTRDANAAAAEVWATTEILRRLDEAEAVAKIEVQPAKVHPRPVLTEPRPRLMRPRPDRKRNRRLLDAELRKRMRGSIRSDDSNRRSRRKK